MSSTDASRIAAGGQPEPFEHTFTHPVHGELTFKGDLPTAKQQMAHHVAVDNYLHELAIVDPETGERAEPRFSTKVLAAALAGMTNSLLLEMPVVGRDESEDEERGSTKVVLIRYDPEAEPDVGFLTDVWMAYSAWRAQYLTQGMADQVGKSSGETTQSDSDTEFAERGASPSTTLA